MKKILITMLMFISLATGTTFAYNRNLTLNTNQYIRLINTNISELNAALEVKEKATIGSILLNGIDEGYIIPSINNNIKLKNSVIELISDIEDTKILDKSLQLVHNELIAELKDLTSLLDDSIECKTNILNSNLKGLKKCQKLLSEDDKQTEIINKKIDTINILYKEINDFTPKVKNPIL